MYGSSNLYENLLLEGSRKIIVGRDPSCNYVLTNYNFMATYKRSENGMFVNVFYVGRGWCINLNNGDIISLVDIENRAYTFSDLGSMPHHPNPGMVLTLA